MLLGRKRELEMIRREGETKRNEWRKEENERRKEDKQAGKQIVGYNEREFCSRYALSMRPRAPPPRRLPRRWLTGPADL